MVSNLDYKKICKFIISLLLFFSYFSIILLIILLVVLKATITIALSYIITLGNSP